MADKGRRSPAGAADPAGAEPPTPVPGAAAPPTLEDGAAPTVVDPAASIAPPVPEPLKPYRGLFVLDASQGIAGPYCATLLAACGAEVVKVEPPAGDWSRGLTTREGTQSCMHVTFNRGKRSVVLDLRTEEGRAAMRGLAAKADVMLEAFRPGVAARLGLVPQAGKPDVVFLSISGFGQRGPYAERPCTDGVAQAYHRHRGAEPGHGRHSPPHRRDDGGGRRHRPLRLRRGAGGAGRAGGGARGGRRTPRPRVLDVSLMQSAAALIGLNIAEQGLSARRPPCPTCPPAPTRGVAATG